MEHKSSVDEQFSDILKTEYAVSFDKKCFDILPEDLRSSYSERFIDLRKRAMVTSYFKYGKLSQNASNEAYSFIESLRLRYDKAVSSCNTEFLVDVANYCMMIYMFPEKGWKYSEVADIRDLFLDISIDGVYNCIKLAECFSNVAYLVPAAVICMLLFVSPPEGWSYKKTDSDESCGIVGYSINEIRNFDY